MLSYISKILYVYNTINGVQCIFNDYVYKGLK